MRALIPVVLTDIWYLNDTDLLMQPAIVIGEPGVNAASAHWGARLPKAFVVDGSHQVLLDLEGTGSASPACGAWARRVPRPPPIGSSSRYLEAWLESVAAV